MKHVKKSDQSMHFSLLRLIIQPINMKKKFLNHCWHGRNTRNFENKAKWKISKYN